jgi:hypothetical protein
MFLSEFYTSPIILNQACPTSIGTNDSGNYVVIGYSDDSLILHDIRSGYKDKIRLEAGGHSDTVKSIVFS